MDEILNNVLGALKEPPKKKDSEDETGKAKTKAKDTEDST
jgi:hypothetical protein